MWINPKTGKVLLTYSDIRQDCSQTSFPVELTDEMISNAGYREVICKAPDFDKITQSATESAPLLINGVWTQQWTIQDLPLEKVAENKAVAARLERETAKAQRDITTAEILVTTAAGNVFNGDEVSQSRLSRAIMALQLTGTLTTHWVLANNVAVEVGVPELAEALALSGAAQTALWVK